MTRAQIRDRLVRDNSDQSSPCDVQSNVRFGNQPTIGQIVEYTLDRNGNESSYAAWHVAYRNCAADATKSSRLLWPRPAWIPLHLRPYHTSWLILSTIGSYDARESIDLKKLNIGGLAAVTQLLGERLVQLSPKYGAECEIERRCAVVGLRLRLGETLVFAADRWRLSYGVDGSVVGEEDDKVGEEFRHGWDDFPDSSGDGLSVSFVAEFDWQY